MSIASDFRTFIRVRWAWMLIAAMFLYGIGVGILAPMNAVYMQEGIGLSKTEIAIVFSTSLLLNMALTISVGFVSDKLQRRKTIPMLAAVLCVSGLFLYMRADSFAFALLGMALATAPSGMIMGQMFAMARNHFSRLAPHVVEMSQLWLRATFSVGFFSGLLLGANIYLVASFQGVLWGNLFGYVALFALLLFYREVLAEPGVRTVKGGEPFSLMMLIALLLLSCADAIRGLYLPLVVNERFGDPRLASYIWSAQAVFELLFMTLAGYWAAKYGSKKIIVLSAMFALTAYLTYATFDSLPLFFIVQPIYSFFVSVLYGVAMGYVQRMFLHRTGFGASLYLFITQTASLIGFVLPLLIEGITPKIFYIPASLIIVSIAIMVKVLHKEKVEERASAHLNDYRVAETHPDN
ncbi:MFS transporter [Cohnella silvisoli]|uniref:MFS transporter n=1 Tax=Cohnella silvisoli TaxID=2873699 RepID=A0ABV1KNX4_9BACL|nr:MFS transporter [Cohnella silvisoli]MCD9020912.1 MFS transporter [Cohnella silvisoli]